MKSHMKRQKLLIGYLANRIWNNMHSNLYNISHQYVFDRIVRLNGHDQMLGTEDIDYHHMPCCDLILFIIRFMTLTFVLLMEMEVIMVKNDSL